jgi:hypothetical protein
MDIRIEKPTDTLSRLSMILWGDSGCGKTTLAATAPGKKLYIMFDPDGDMSIRNLPDWQRIYLANETSTDITKEAIKPDPFGLYAKLNDFDTIIVDSLTKFSEHALKYSVTVNMMKKATLENPGLAGYGTRNIYVGAFVSNMIRITGMLNKHIIFITHERAPELNNDGAITGVNMMLGGQLPNVTSKDISEVWNMRDHAGKRYIAIRPERFRSPMKSRMFDMTNATSFEWKYNANTDDGMTISDWWVNYVSSDYKKLPIPR